MCARTNGSKIHLTIPRIESEMVVLQSPLKVSTPVRMANTWAWKVQKQWNIIDTAGIYVLEVN